MFVYKFAGRTKLSIIWLSIAEINTGSEIETPGEVLPESLNPNHVRTISLKITIRIDPAVGIGSPATAIERIELRLFQRSGFKPYECDIIGGVHGPVVGEPLCEGQDHTLIFLAVIQILITHTCRSAADDVVAKISDIVSLSQGGGLYLIQHGVYVTGPDIRVLERFPHTTNDVPSNQVSRVLVTY